LVAALVSAIAALGGLYVAFRTHTASQRRSRIRIGAADSGLYIWVTNVGGQATSVLAIGLQRHRLGATNTSGPFVTYEFDSDQAILPCRLEPGHSERWLIPWSDLTAQTALMEFMSPKWPPKWLRRMVVFIDTGEEWHHFNLRHLSARWHDPFWDRVAEERA
jgi:hypothetical protein